MPRRKYVPKWPDHWEISYEYVANGRYIHRGTELKISRIRGRFRFLRHVRSTIGENVVEWIDVWGGPKGSPAMRSFRPERIARVHRLTDTPEGLLENRKAAKN